MKTLKTFLLALVTLFSVTSMAQADHTFHVTQTAYQIGTYTISDTTVEVGDVVEFVNSFSNVMFDVNIDGVGVYSTPGTLSMGSVIYTYTFSVLDIDGGVDIYVGPGTQPNYFQNIHFTVVNPSTTGFEDLSDVTFTVFPNPTSDFLNITTSDNIESVKVFDMNGRLVLSNTYNTSNVKLDVMSLTNGYYTVLVNDVKPIKFIKN
jgi:hypothetical protein